ncbi:MAG: hypothetical protein NTNFB01_28840 [Nitrospira sp.]
MWEDREDALILLITFEPESNSHLHTSVHAPIKSHQSCFEFWCKFVLEAFSFAGIVTGSFNFLHAAFDIETMKFGNAWIVVPCVKDRLFVYSNFTCIWENPR